MLLSTHLAAGLIISKLTGNYNASLLGSVIMDLDHFIAYYRTGILFKFKKVLIATTGKADIGLPQRNFFHNIFFCLLVSAIASSINFSFGLAFGAAYILHLVLDSLDNSNYYPFYPNLKINLRGPLKYFSKQELIFTFILLLIFFII
ncbi:metal-dependent hydrolase [Candidatus Falkowbacteria bacterium]|nr:metal-dependent hydrolase [Candidatus Falkowbacteria bacterium]